MTDFAQDFQLQKGFVVGSKLSDNSIWQILPPCVIGYIKKKSSLDYAVRQLLAKNRLGIEKRSKRHGQ